MGRLIRFDNTTVIFRNRQGKKRKITSLAVSADQCPRQRSQSCATEQELQKLQDKLLGLSALGLPFSEA
jgi:hypothetical protein